MSNKIIAALSVCLFMGGISHGQTAAAPKKGTDKTVIGKGNNVTGTIRNLRNKPIKGVEAYVYKEDSSIIASANTDSAGHYTTNSVPAGKYFVKLVYPSRKFALIYGIEIKAGALELDYKADAPDADTMFSYDNIRPKAIAKKDDKKK